MRQRPRHHVGIKYLKVSSRPTKNPIGVIALIKARGHLPSWLCHLLLPLCHLAERGMATSRAENELQEHKVILHYFYLCALRLQRLPER